MNMSDWEIDWQRRKAQLLADTNLNRKAVMDKLAELGVRLVTVEYEGSDDSGQIHGVFYYRSVEVEGDVLVGRGDIEDETPIQNARIFWKDSHTNQWPQPSEPTIKEISLSDGVYGLCYGYLGVTHGGWENNEGAEGQFDLDVETGEVRLTHRARIIDYETTDHVF